MKNYKRADVTLQDLTPEQPKERLLTFSITAPESAWAAVKKHIGEASGADYFIYSALKDALENV